MCAATCDGDARGGSPTAATSSRVFRAARSILPPPPEHGGPFGVAEKQRRKELKDLKMERILHHLDLPADDAVAVTRARRPDCPRGYAPRPTKKPPRRHIAYHHFHPQLLQALVVGRGKTTIDFIEAQTISGLGLWNHGYGEDDSFTGVISRAGTKRKGRVDGFVPVPTYRHARRDCARVSARVRVDALIPKCRAAAAAASPASGESATGKAKNAASAELNERDVGDLQRAVCLMADESEWPRQKVVEMEAQIKAIREALGATAVPEAAGEEDEAGEAAAPPVKRRRSDGRRLCDAEGCASLAVRRGVSQAHGSAPKPCRVEGCRNQAKNHGGESRARGRPSRLPPPTTFSRLTTDRPADPQSASFTGRGGRTAPSRAAGTSACAAACASGTAAVPHGGPPRRRPRRRRPRRPSRASPSQGGGRRTSRRRCGGTARSEGSTGAARPTVIRRKFA